MSVRFDAYHKWLGIPPAQQPPTHYRLLGLEPFETDRDVIDAAANQRMSYLQELAAGPNGKESQKLLNEVARARRCLLDPAAKTAYDDSLRANAPPPATASAVVPSPLPADPVPSALPADPVPPPVAQPEDSFLDFAPGPMPVAAAAAQRAKPRAAEPADAAARPGRKKLLLAAGGGAGVLVLGAVVSYAAFGGKSSESDAAVSVTPTRKTPTRGAGRTRPTMPDLTPAAQPPASPAKTPPATTPGKPSPPPKPATPTGKPPTPTGKPPTPTGKPPTPTGKPPTPTGKPPTAPAPKQTSAPNKSPSPTGK